MLSLSVHIQPHHLSAQGYTWYHADSSSFDTLEIDCSDVELRVSVLSDSEVLHELRVCTPERLFIPFSTSTTHIGSIPSLSVTPFECKEDEDGQIVSKFSALTTEEKALDPTTKIKIKNWSKIQETSSKKELNHSLFIAELSFGLECLDSRLLGRVAQNSRTPLLENSRLPIADKSCLPNLLKDFLKNRIKVNAPYHVMCSSCNHVLSAKALQFARVEVCCEGLTSEMSDSWFCHAEALSPISAVLPQSLYFDSACFYLHSSVMKGLSLGILDDHRWECNVCGSVLTSSSRPVQGFTPFFCDKIEFRGLDASLIDHLYRFKLMWITLWSFIGSAFETSTVCKLYLYSKGTESELCLLLCVSPDRRPWFLSQTSSSAQVDFDMEDAYCVSYLVSSPSSKTVCTWRHDFAVDFYRVSDAAMSVFIDYLTASSACLPCKTTDDGFSKAFLPTSFHGAQMFLNKS